MTHEPQASVWLVTCGVVYVSCQNHGCELQVHLPVRRVVLHGNREAGGGFAGQSSVQTRCDRDVTIC